MGTQYEIINIDKKEYITGESLGWDSKRCINSTGRLSGILYLLIYISWGGDRIKIISVENLEYDEQEEFYNKYKDVSKQAYEYAKKEYPEDF